MKRPCFSPSRRWEHVGRMGGSALALLLLAGSTFAAASTADSYQYLSPRPDSRMVSPWNNIVIRHESTVDAGSLNDGLLTVIGSESGRHTGELVLSNDQRTLVFNPDQPFALGETVSVRLGKGMKSRRGVKLPPTNFHFVISQTDPRAQPVRAPELMFPGLPTVPPEPPPLPAERLSWPLSSIHCDSLPIEYPDVTLLASNNPEPGAVFLSPFSFPDTKTHLLILDNLGMPLFYRLIPDVGWGLDFKVQPHGPLTYYSTRQFKFMVMDSTYAIVDSVRAGNGYRIDPHDLQLRADGHALLMIYDQKSVDMSVIVPGGHPNALVAGLIIQELDAAKNVVFQWSSWNHFEITDAASAEVSLTDSVIDYVHGNSVEWDFDGNILFSSRHLSEITKIDRQTGDVIWRMGLNAKKNQFTFINDIKGFSHQHGARRLPNGHLTLFDNGNHIHPEYSRALEYVLDEASLTATLVWEGRMSPDVFGGFMGNAQRLAGGGTMIGWGGIMSPPALTEIHADGYRAFELGFPPGVYSYRAFRFPWRTNRFLADVQSLDFGVVGVGGSSTLPVSVRNNTGTELTISCVVSTDSAFSAPGFAPVALLPGASTIINVEFAPVVDGEASGNLYIREVNDTELVAQVVAIRGVGTTTVSAEDPGNLQFRVHANSPNPFSGETSIRFDVARTSKVTLEIYDIRGREVQKLVDETRPAGRYQETWSSEGVPSGLYFYRFQAGDFVQTRKLIVLE